MTIASRVPPFDPRPRQGARQWPLGFAVLLASVLNAIVWAGLFAVAKAFLRL